MPNDASHPFWGRRPNRPDGDEFRFAGGWSVRLTSQGFHTNHIHRSGWISSALYVALPDEMRDAGGPRRAYPVRRSPVETGLALPPQRIDRTADRRTLLFPSYMWHGTVPFTSGRALPWRSIRSQRLNNGVVSRALLDTGVADAARPTGRRCAKGRPLAARSVTRYRSRCSSPPTLRTHWAIGGLRFVTSRR